jgi:hypothetical protein
MAIAHKINAAFLSVKSVRKRFSSKTFKEGYIES